MHSIHINIIIVIVATTFTYCGPKKITDSDHGAPSKETNVITLTASQYRMAGIEIGHAEMRTISGIIQASGKLDVPPQNKVSISAPMGGIVKETELLQGTHVRKGQPVAVMQHNDYIQLQQEYKEIHSQIEYLKAEYERQEELGKENVNSKKTIQKAKAEYLSAKAKLEGLRARLELLNINISALESGTVQNSITLYSPIEGYVTKVNVNIGSFVSANNVMFEIVNPDHLHAELTVFEKDVPMLKKGQRVLFTLANETKYRMARVYLIGKEISPDRSIQVHCHLDNEDKSLIPGMYLNAVVETDSALVPALPEGAIVSFGEKKYIFLAGDQVNEKVNTVRKFEMAEIGTAETVLGFTHVILPPGVDLKTPIVTRGAYTLLSAAKNSPAVE